MDTEREIQEMEISIMISNQSNKNNDARRDYEYRYMLKAEDNPKQNQQHQTIPHGNICSQASSRANGYYVHDRPVVTACV